VPTGRIAASEQAIASLGDDGEWSGCVLVGSALDM
jgi:hypothetical protein